MTIATFEKLLNAAYRSKMWLSGLYSKDMEREDDLKLANRIEVARVRFPLIFPPIDPQALEDDDLHG